MCVALAFMNSRLPILLVRSVIGMTASSPEEIAATKKQFGLTFDFYFCDGITIKTIERANPSIVLLEKGTIKQKVHHNDIEDLKF